MRRGWMLAGLLAAGLACSGPAARAQDTRFLTIGAGAVGGVYYPLATAICRLVNRGAERHGARCAAQVTGGSIANIEAIRDRGIDFAIVQGDIERSALEGTGAFDGVPLAQLRTVFSLHSETFTLMVRADSDIEDLADLPGRRVNLGAFGSGQRATLERVLTPLGVEITDLVATEASGRGIVAEICGGEAEALVQTIGHPAAILREAAEACALRLLPVTGPAIDVLLEESPAYSRAVIPGGIYPGAPEPVETFSVRAALVTREETDAGIVGTVARAVLDNLSEFRAQHPALAELEPRAMLNGGASAPLHPGALGAYRELGMIE